MQRTRKLIKTLVVQPYLKFYEIMKYPVPKNTELFFQYSDTEHTNANKILKDTSENENLNWFSRDKKSEYLDEYLQEIKRLESIFQSIPFVEQIFLCNSISFNALDKNSDIDLLISTPNKEGVFVKSKEIICPKCYEPCKIKIENYKIKLYDCVNNHIIDDIEEQNIINLNSQEDLSKAVPHGKLL